MYTDYRRLLGPGHPYTVSALRRTTSSLRRRQRRLKVLGIRKQALAEAERRSGPLGDDTVVARRELGAAYVSVGLVWRNVAIQRRLLTDLTEELGPDHPWTRPAGLVGCQRPASGRTGPTTPGPGRPA